jgi:hypothetical protein
MIDLNKIIFYLRPNAQKNGGWSNAGIFNKDISNNKKIYNEMIWNSSELKPNFEECQSIYSILIQLKYIDNRKITYPDISNQLDMLWHSMNSGEIPKSENFFNSIKVIKDKYPKIIIEKK